jgi:hypothetical protein
MKAPNKAVKTSGRRCFCGAALEWVKKGKELRCPEEGVVYILPSQRA